MLDTRCTTDSFIAVLLTRLESRGLDLSSIKIPLVRRSCELDDLTVVRNDLVSDCMMRTSMSTKRSRYA